MLHNKYEQLFQENVVMTIEHLKLATGRPRESILRDLRRIGYYSSYNAKGKFYTLGDIAEFDELGLWKYQDAFFSSRKTLLDTVEYLVNTSTAGFTHDQLREILGIEIQNSLYRLITASRIMRSRIGSQYVYFGNKNINEQRKKRNDMPIAPIVRKRRKTLGTSAYPDMKSELVIDILIAVLRGHETISAAYSHLNKIGSTITEQQVMAVFHHYDICKKNSPTQK